MSFGDVFQEYSEYLRKREGLDDNWCVYEASVERSEVPEGFIKIRGCNFEKYKRGPKKGQFRIYGAKIDKGTDRVFFLKGGEWL